MALLVYSDKCKYCADIISFIKSEPSLLTIIRFHNITTQGIPHKKITRVPTLVTNEGTLCVGTEVKAWVSSMIPNDFESWDPGSTCSNLDGSENSNMFELDNYGASLQPQLTDEMEARINMNVSDAMQQKRE